MLHGHHLLPQRLVVFSHGLPALPAIGHPVTGDFLAPEVVDGEFTVQTDADVDPLATTLGRHAVAVAPHIDVGIPAHMADVVIAGIEVRCRTRAELVALFLKALSRRLLELAQCPLAGIAAQPLFQ